MVYCDWKPTKDSESGKFIGRFLGDVDGSDGGGGSNSGLTLEE